MKKFFFLLFLITAWGNVTGQAQDRSELDRYFEVLAKNNKFMGSILLRKDGKTVYSKSVGMANVAQGMPNSDNTRYRIGSVSKTFTASLLFTAIDEKKIKLSDKLARFYPEVPNADQISIEHLLSHRSGIHNFTSDSDYLQWHTTPKTEQQMLDIIVKGGSDFSPGSQYDYSNANFVLVSYILQKIYDQPLAALIQSKIAKPLNLQNTYYGDAITSGKNEANSYRFMGNWAEEPQTDMSIPSGAGAIVSTTADLATFIEALFGGKVVSEESLKQMKGIRKDLGMGLYQIPFNEKIGYGHTGAIDAFATMLVYFPEDKVTLAFSSNGSNFNNNSIAIEALNWVFGKPVNVPQFSNISVSAEDLDRYVGDYSSAQMPINIKIFRNGTTLMGQGTDQPAFPLDPIGPHEFSFERAGLVLTFDPDLNQMVLKQGGTAFTYTKK